MPERADILSRVAGSDLCAGCGLCEGLLGRQRVSVELDRRGYLRPVVHEAPSREETRLLDAVCPGRDVRHASVDRHHHAIWGPLRETWVAAAADPEIRQLGSSGGVLSAIQIHLLERGIVDYVVSTRVSAHDPLENETAICRTRADVLAATGSRYAPSAPLRRIGELLAAPGRFAFVGKPCDVAALRRLALHDPRVDAKVPVMLSFMCAGVPSLVGTECILDRLGVRREEVVRFRYRGDGWPGFAKATLRDGTERSMSYEDSWRHILSPHVQWRCKLCPDGTGEFADIACADAWHRMADGSPDFSEHAGRSFALARTERGLALLGECLAAGRIEREAVVGPDAIEAVQFHQAYRRKTLLGRHVATRLCLSATPRYNIMALLTAWKTLSLKAQARSFVGTLKRAVTQLVRKANFADTRSASLKDAR